MDRRLFAFLCAALALAGCGGSPIRQDAASQATSMSAADDEVEDAQDAPPGDEDAPPPEIPEADPDDAPQI